MAKYYNKLQPKLKPWPFVVIGAILLAFVLLVVLLTPSKHERFYNVYTTNGAEITKDHPFVEISYKTLMKKIDSEEKLLVYFGYASCQVCLSEIKYYESELTTQEVNEFITSIYYVDVTKLSSAQLTEFNTAHLIDLSDSPDLVYFENKVVLLERADYTSSDTTVPAAQQIRNFYKAIKDKQ
ncbi:MAG: hypothetical protein M0Q00_05280 [Acholeplasmataceae bacterium]|nr:hypothetical protein [Acholeplasmataceae bacterium]